MKKKNNKKHKDITPNNRQNKKYNSRQSKFRKRFLSLKKKQQEEAQLRILQFHEETVCKVCGYKASSRESLVKHFYEKIKSGSKLHEINITSTGFDIKIKPIKPNFATSKSKIYDPDTPKVSVWAISNGVETNRRNH